MDDNTNTISTEQNTVETQVSNQPPIPAELDGIPEDIAREVMQEAETTQPQETAPQPTATEQTETEDASAPDDEAAVENNDSTDEDANLPKHPIPYDRFKKKVDETNKLKAEIAELKKLMEQQRQQLPQVVYQQPPQVQQPIQQAPAPQPAFTFETAQMINNRIFALAKEMTGMTQEEIDAVEYADNNDANKTRWNIAVEVARSSVVADIRKYAADAVQHRETMMNQQQQAMADYSNYVGQQTAEPDFKAISEYAQNEYFLAQSQIKQRAIADAYSRVTRNTASPQDLFLVTHYFDAAKADYRAKQAAAKQQPKTPAPAQVKKTPSAPPSKFDQIGGTVTVQTSPSLEQIEKMMREKLFEELPQDLQNLLLNGTTG